MKPIFILYADWQTEGESKLHLEGSAQRKFKIEPKAPKIKRNIQKC